MMKAMIALLMVSGALLSGCKDDAKPADGKTGDTKAADSKGGGAISVPECDEYLKKVDACKGPAAAGLKGSAEAIRANLKNPGGDATTAAALKSSLATTCKSSMAALAACQ